MSIKEPVFEIIPAEQLSVTVGDFPVFDMNVRFKDGKVVEVVDDVSREIFAKAGQSSFNQIVGALKKIGIPITYEPWMSDDETGYIAFKKADINKVLLENKLSITKNPKGDLLIQ